MALFLYVRSAVVRSNLKRVALASAVGVTGIGALPAHAAFAPEIPLVWMALSAAAFLLIRFFERRTPVFDQLWNALDFIAVGSFAASAVYTLAELILYPAERPSRLLLLGALVVLAACIHLFHELDRANVLQRPAGLAFGQTLMIAGLIPWCFGFRRVRLDAYIASVPGVIILLIRLKTYFGTTEERRVLKQMSVEGEKLQPEYTEPSSECPQPRLWSMYDPMTAEKEVLELLYAVVRAAKPRLALETGTFSGISSIYMARAMQENGRGRLITCEFDPVVHENARARFQRDGLSSIVDCRLGSSLELDVNDEIDLLYCDSAVEIRGAEVRRFLRNVNPFGLILMHDAGSRFKVVREAALQMEAEGLISVVLISTPRGLVLAQKREGRR